MTEKDDKPPKGEGVDSKGFSMRWTDDDRALVAKLKTMTGLTSTAELVRTSLRALERELTRAGGTPP